jgi:SNF2 family DNA or RNA helicase
MWKHQQEAVEWAVGRLCCLLHMGMGTGKTRACLELIKREGLAKILVCCPKAVVPAWGKQAGLWLPEYRIVLLTKGSSAQKEKEIAAALADKSPVIIVTNYESAWRVDLVEKTSWDCLVYDEVHRLKSPSGVTSRWAARMGKKNPKAKRIGLSGTLLAHSPLDAYGVYRAIESPNCETFGQSYATFRANYAVTRPGYPGWVIGYRNTEQFGTKIAQTTFHRKSEDVLDLPEIMHEQVEVELSPPEARLYREIENDFCAVAEDGEVTPANVLVQLLRLLEVCGGSVHYDGNSDASPIVETPSKAAALREIMEDLPPNEPIVVFCKYRADIEAILRECEKSGRAASELSGRKNELEAWQAGETSVLVANTASGGIGIDCTKAAYGVFYSVGHSLSEYLQAIARLHRPGQSRTTHFYNLVATVGGGKKTVDGCVYDALESREEVIDAIISGYRGTQRPGVAAGKNN